MFYSIISLIFIGDFFMVNVQQKFKKNFLAAILIIFAMHNASSYAVVEKPNLMPFFVLGGAGVAAFIAGTLLNPANLYNLLEEKAIEAWIAKNDLNQFGEPKDTVYQDDVTGPLDGQSRIEYIKAKFIDEDVKPWRSGFVRLLNRINGLDHSAATFAFGGVALMFFALVASTVLHSQYTNASWQETIAGWKADSAELEKKLVSDISAAVIAGMSNASVVTNNA